MHIYYLTQNLMYNCKHVVRKRWYHGILGEPSLKIDFVEEANQKSAEAKFRLKGHHFGLLH